MKEIFENLCKEYKKKGAEAEVSASIFQGEFCITMRKSNGIARKRVCSANVRVLAEGCGESCIFNKGNKGPLCPLYDSPMGWDGFGGKENG